MRSRLIQNAVLLAVVPFFTVLLASVFWEIPQLRVEITLLGIVAQIPMTLICKRDIQPLFRPADQVMTSMCIRRIPAAYEPGKYRVDFRVTALCLWLGILGPIFSYLAHMFPSTVTNPIPMFPNYTLPNTTLLLLSLLCILVGSLSMLLWGRFGQAVAIANESNDGRRYLYRGFAEHIDEPACFLHYQECTKPSHHSGFLSVSHLPH